MHLDEKAKNELADIKAELEAQEQHNTEVTPPAGAPPIKVENGPIALKAGDDKKKIQMQ